MPSHHGQGKGEVTDGNGLTVDGLSTAQVTEAIAPDLAKIQTGICHVFCMHLLPLHHSLPTGISVPVMHSSASLTINEVSSVAL